MILFIFRKWEINNFQWYREGKVYRHHWDAHTGTSWSFPKLFYLFESIPLLPQKEEWWSSFRNRIVEWGKEISKYQLSGQVFVFRMSKKAPHLHLGALFITSPCWILVRFKYLPQHQLCNLRWRQHQWYRREGDWTCKTKSEHSWRNFSVFRKSLTVSIVPLWSLSPCLLPFPPSINSGRHTSQLKDSGRVGFPKRVTKIRV